MEKIRVRKWDTISQRGGARKHRPSKKIHHDHDDWEGKTKILRQRDCGNREAGIRPQRQGRGGTQIVSSSAAAVSGVLTRGAWGLIGVTRKAVGTGREGREILGIERERVEVGDNGSGERVGTPLQYTQDRKDRAIDSAPGLSRSTRRITPPTMSIARECEKDHPTLCQGSCHRIQAFFTTVIVAQLSNPTNALNIIARPVLNSKTTGSEPASTLQINESAMHCTNSRHETIYTMDQIARRYWSGWAQTWKTHRQWQYNRTHGTLVFQLTSFAYVKSVHRRSSLPLSLIGKQPTKHFGFAHTVDILRSNKISLVAELEHNHTRAEVRNIFEELSLITCCHERT